MRTRFHLFRPRHSELTGRGLLGHSVLFLALVHPWPLNAQDQQAFDYVLPKVARYAAAVFAKYDGDADGMLSEAEWRSMSGEPQRIDVDGNGTITLDEFQRHIWNYGQARRPVAVASIAESNNPATAGDDPRSRSVEPAEGLSSTETEGESTGAAKPRETKYTVRPSRGLGKLPGWFLGRDSDGDGQLSLREFSADSAGRLREFERLDRNGDGVVTPREATSPRSSN